MWKPSKPMWICPNQCESVQSNVKTVQTDVNRFNPIWKLSKPMLISSIQCENCPNQCESVQPNVKTDVNLFNPKWKRSQVGFLMLGMALALLITLFGLAIFYLRLTQIFNWKFLTLEKELNLQIEINFQLKVVDMWERIEINWQDPRQEGLFTQLFLPYKEYR